MIQIDTKYFEGYRQKFGFTNQGDVKIFFADKDIISSVDFSYISLFNKSLISNDDLINIETFQRSSKADLKVNLKNGNKIRLEIQSIFQGINDIKQHKVIKAKNIFRATAISSLAIHFDLFNRQVAFIKLNSIREDSVNWITRQQMEGQTVFNIDQKKFFYGN